MNEKGQLAAYEALIILVLMGSSAWMFYLYAHKPSDAQIYQAGSKPIVNQPEFTSHFGCNNPQVDYYFERSTNVVSTNSQVKH